MRAVVFVVRRRGGLEQALEFLALALLPFDLILEQRDLAGELAVRVMRLVRAASRIANAAFDDGLVDGVGLGRFLGHEAEADEDSFDCSKHNGGAYVAWLFFLQQDLFLEDELELLVQLFLIGRRDHASRPVL